MKREEYIIAKANGLEEQYRGDEIAKEISQFVTPNEQQALQTNMINDLIACNPFSHQTEWDYYQSVRAAAIEKIDNQIKEWENI